MPENLVLLPLFCRITRQLHQRSYPPFRHQCPGCQLVNEDGFIKETGGKTSRSCAPHND